MQEQILDDLDVEVAELTELVNELVAVASGELVDQPAERLDLVEMATEVAAAGRASPFADDRRAVACRRRWSTRRGPASTERSPTSSTTPASSIRPAARSRWPSPWSTGTTDHLTVLDRGPGIPAADVRQGVRPVPSRRCGAHDAGVGSRPADRPRGGRGHRRDGPGGEPRRRRRGDRVHVCRVTSAAVAVLAVSVGIADRTVTACRPPPARRSSSRRWPALSSASASASIWSAFGHGDGDLGQRPQRRRSYVHLRARRVLRGSRRARRRRSARRRPRRATTPLRSRNTSSPSAPCSVSSVALLQLADRRLRAAAHDRAGELTFERGLDGGDQRRRVLVAPRRVLAERRCATSP